ncbi:MAG: DUF3108 domain-containing protein [Paludibacteraceae bacterium]|nr:DUF3108 domain-containing protein [Paludibacteraceae bacterium]
MLKRIIYTCLSLILFMEVSAQTFKEPAFKVGEVAVYNIYYNLGFVWIHAGDVEFSVKNVKENGVDHFYLQLAGYTIRSFDSFYRIRDTFHVSVTKDSLLPCNYREVKHEDTYFCDRRYHYNFDSTPKVYCDFNRKGVKSKDTLDMAAGVYDLLTICYRFRSLDMSQVKVGDSFPFKMLYDKDTYNLGLTYKGVENIKLRNKTKHNALKFMPKLITGDLFKKEDDMVIYVSNDENHVPLYIEAKIKVGSVKVMLNSVKNTKYPFTSQIK